jgi:hypothetical protein
MHAPGQKEATMATAEQSISRALQTILAELPIGENIPDSEEFRRKVLLGLEWWLPDIIGEIHREWIGMGCDGIFPVLTRKTGDGEAEIFGQYNFIQDQTLTPFYVRLQIAPTEGEVSWLEFKVGERLQGKRGERGKHGMVMLPYTSRDATYKRLYLMNGDVDRIDWAYSVTFGQRRA